MNVFYTDECPIQAARNLPNVLRRKMIVEHAQLLSCAHHVLDGDNALQGIYKKTHQNHPSSIFTRSGQYQYEWVLDCAMEMCRLYTLQTGKIHKTQSTLETLRVLPKNIPLIDWQDPPIAAPDKFKVVAVFNGVIAGYRAYMQAKFEEWQQREKPIKVEFFKYSPDWLKV